LTAGLSGTALAQTPAPTPTTSPTSTAPVYVGDTRSHWEASGFVGSSFGAAAHDPTISYGGQFAYLWNGFIGGEFIGDAAPNFKLDNALLSGQPNVYSYMANAIVALPLGAMGQIVPFVSGGVGAIHLTSNVLTFGPAVNPPILPLVPTGTSSESNMRFGSNIGGGLMLFANNIGFRGDIRYYKASTDNNPSTTDSPTSQVNQALLSGIDFWRANVGVSFRW